MSKAIYERNTGLRFWTENEIILRNQFQERAVFSVKSALTKINSAWKFIQMEGPTLIPREYVNTSYSEDDIFVTNHSDLVLRPETTYSSFAYLRHLYPDHMQMKKKMPLCVWQAGKSYRRETNDGASAAKLRFNEFYQLEFQCVYTLGTMTDYRSVIIPLIRKEIERFCGAETRVVDSDRLPSYSTNTTDIEIKMLDGSWKELASCSIRTDFAEGFLVCEIAIGLDRVVHLANKFESY